MTGQIDVLARHVTNVGFAGCRIIVVALRQAGIDLSQGLALNRGAREESREFRLVLDIRLRHVAMEREHREEQGWLPALFLAYG